MYSNQSWQSADLFLLHRRTTCVVCLQIPSPTPNTTEPAVNDDDSHVTGCEHKGLSQGLNKVRTQLQRLQIVISVKKTKGSVPKWRTS